MKKHNLSSAFISKSFLNLLIWFQNCLTTSSSSPQIFLRKRFKTLWLWYCIPFNTLSEWPQSFLWCCFAAAVTWNISFHLAQPSDIALTSTSWQMHYRLRYASSTPAMSKIRYAKLRSDPLRYARSVDVPCSKRISIVCSLWKLG